jgi:hypothetical protein
MLQIRFEVLTAPTVMITGFWDVTPFSRGDFGAICCLHLQGGSHPSTLEDECNTFVLEMLQMICHIAQCHILEACK